ncbi:hypothetical protein ACFU5W_33020, partial [Streptomyces laurentii]
MEVMRVAGTSTHDGKGVDVIVRVSGSAYDKWPDHEKITATRCRSRTDRGEDHLPRKRPAAGRRVAGA